jgi:hypothetical protein
LTLPCAYAELRVYEMDGSTARGVLPCVTGPDGSDEVGGGGAVTFSVPMQDPKLAADPALLDDCVVKVAMPLAAGAAPTEVAAYAVRGGVKRDVLARGARVAEVGGVSLLQAWGRDAVVRPEYAGANMPRAAGEERVIGWQSSAYDPDDDPSVWVDINEDTRAFYPNNWPLASDAVWVTCSGSGDRKLYRGWLTVTGSAARPIRLFFSSDDSAFVWVAGELMIQTNDTEMGWKKTYTKDLSLEPGTYAVAVSVDVHVAVDVTGPSTTSDPMILAVGLLGGDGEVGSWLLVSNETDFVGARVSSTAATPGPTPGGVALLLMAEAQARNVTTWDALTADFDGAEDSDGQAWGEVEERSLRYSVDTYAAVFSGMGDVEFDPRITPGLVLQARRFEGQDRTTGDAPVVIRRADNATTIQETTIGVAATVLDSYCRDGHLTITDSAGVSAYGRREGGVELGTAASMSQARRVVLSALGQMAHVGTSADVEFIAVPGCVPYADFWPGDTVLVSSGDGSTTVERRVLALAFRGGERPVRWTAEVGEALV